MGIYAPPPHPTVKLQSAAASAQGAVRPGSPLEVTAITNQSSRAAWLQFALREQSPMGLSGGIDTVSMRDDGREGDRQARDGEWYGRCDVPASPGSEYVPVVTLHFRQTLHGPRYQVQWMELPPLHVEAPPASPPPDPTPPAPGAGGGK